MIHPRSLMVPALLLALTLAPGSGLAQDHAAGNAAPENAAPEMVGRKPVVWAVLVAIDHYEKGDDVIPPCPGALRDVRALRRWMQEQGGWPAENVLVLDRFSQRGHGEPRLPLANLYPSRENLDWALQSWLPARVQPGDIVLIYFAGQALGLPPAADAPSGTPDRNFLLPIDADLADVDRTGWPIENALDRLASSGQNPVIVLLDTSLSGRGQPVQAVAEPPAADRWLATVARWPSISAWLAASGRPALEGPAGQTSPFVTALLDGLGTAERRRNLLACLAQLNANADLTEQGFRTAGGVPAEASLWSVDLTPRPVAAPELVLRHGHSDRVVDLALPPDGATILSAGADSTVKVWRAEDRALLRTLPNHFVGVTRAVISADGRRLASGDGMGRVWVWTLPEFRALTITNPTPHQGRIVALEFLDDGTQFATLDSQGAALLWDVSDRESVAEPLASSVSALACGGGRVATASIDPATGGSRVAIRNTDGRKVAEVPGPGGIVTAGSLALAGDHLAAGDRNGAVVLWDLSETPPRQIARHELGGGPVTSIRLTATVAAAGVGSSVRLLPLDGSPPRPGLDLDAPVMLTAATPDGRLVAAASARGTLAAWDLTDLADPRPLTLDEDDGAGPTVATALAFAPGGQRLVVGCQGGAIRSWTLPGGIPLPEIAAHRGQILRLAVAPDPRYLLQITRDRDAHLWDLDAGRALTPIPGRWTSGAFLPDGAELVLTDEDGDVVLVDRTTLKRRERTFERPRVPGRDIPTHAAFDVVAVAPDGRHLAAGSAKTDLACLWETETGRLIRAIRAHPEGVTTVAFAADSSRLLTAGPDGTVNVWGLEDAADAPPAQTFGAEDDPITVAIFDPAAVEGGAGPRVVTGHQDGRVLRWESGADGQSVSTPLTRLAGMVRALAFTSGGTTLVAAGEDKAIRWVDLSGPRPRDRRLTPLHDERVNALVAWPDAPLVASGSEDTTIRLWRIEANDSRLLGTLAATPETGDWVAFTPAGRFDSAPGAECQVAWVQGGEARPLEQFYDRYRSFRLSATLRRGAEPGPVPPYAAGPPPSLAIDPPPTEAADRSLNLTLNIGEDELRGLRLYLNGVPVRDDTDFSRPDAADPSRLIVTAPLRRGQNELYAMAARPLEGSPMGRSNVVTVRYEGPDRPGRLHVLALGVDDYRNRPLQFAAKDARTLAEFLRGHAVDGAIADARVQVLTNTQVSTESVQAALSEIRAAAQPEDTVVVFIAGHSDVRSDPVGRDRFCLLLPGFPFEDVELDEGIRVASRGVIVRGPGDPPGPAPVADDPTTVLPYPLIERYLVRMDALQRLVVLDACEAEAAVQDPTVMRIRENVARKVDDDAHQARTTYLLASRRDMPALEVEELGHGLLTYVMLRGMGAAELPQLEAVPFAGADANQDGLITTSELRRFTDLTLPALATRFVPVAMRGEAGNDSRLPPDVVLPAQVQGASEATFPLVRVPQLAP